MAFLDAKNSSGGLDVYEKFYKKAKHIVLQLMLQEVLQKIIQHL